MAKTEPTLLHKVIAAALLVGVGWGAVTMLTTPKSAAQIAAGNAKRCTDTIMAFVVSQDFAKQQLKAPSSAKFPSINEAAVKQTGECEFEVASHVDAQNSFGAMLRSSYVARVRYSPKSGRWSGAAVVDQ